MVVKYKSNLNTILISKAFWVFFHPLHFCLLNWSPKSTITASPLPPFPLFCSKTGLAT